MDETIKLLKTKIILPRPFIASRDAQKCFFLTVSMKPIRKFELHHVN